MNFVPLSCEFRGESYSLCPVSGALLRGISAGKLMSYGKVSKLEDALSSCQSPYTLKPTNYDATQVDLQCAPSIARGILNRTKWIRKFGFLIARSYASIRRPLFDTSETAVAYFNRHTVTSTSVGHCLARSLFAAKTSRSFPDHGVILIGVFMPSTLMHAWIVEDGGHADPEDRIWTQYYPVGALI